MNKSMKNIEKRLSRIEKMLSVMVEEDKGEQGTENEGQDGNKTKLEIKTILKAYDTSLGQLSNES